MKRCEYCGKEYPDEASECAIDGEPLEPFPPEPKPTGDSPGDEVKTVVIRTFNSHEAAQLAASNLEAHGIKCWITADDGGGMYPNLTVAGGVRLSVAVSDAEAADALLNARVSPAEISQIEAEAVASASPEPVSPGKPAPGQLLVGMVIGAILGILLCLFYQWANQLGTKSLYHYRQGLADEEWIYRNGKLVEFLEDRNLDGKWDRWDHYEHGHLVRAEYDNNFDGKPDVWWTFSEDGTDTVQRDTDFNGIPDVFCNYKNHIIQQVDTKPNGSTLSTERELYQNGVLTEIERGEDIDGHFKEIVRYDPFFNPIGTQPINSNSAAGFNLSLPVSR
ncbi:MAG TPA: hypothetical protein VMA35_07465 [Candidatus Sulfopaludibacter sp.]|nr:hypothetical protein [Candidatus Sulfopaludibacter sp.]